MFLSESFATVICQWTPGLFLAGTTTDKVAGNIQRVSLHVDSTVLHLGHTPGVDHLFSPFVQEARSQGRSPAIYPLLS